MFLKNTAGQFIHFQGVDSSTGGIKSGVTWTARRCIDGTFAAATGTVTEDGTTGWYKFAMSQADTNGNNIGFNFTGTGAVPQTVNIVTTSLNPYDAVRFGMTALPNANAAAAGGLWILGANAAATTTLTGVAAAGATPATPALSLTGGAASTTGGGVAAQALLATGGAGAASTNGAAEGVKMIGGGTNTVASNAHGLNVTGTSTGSGMGATSGAGTTGNGITATSAATNGNGIAATGNGTGDGVLSTGGAGAGGDGISAVAGGGVDFRANQTGNLTGNVSGSVGSVTGAVGSVTGAVGSVTGAVGSVTGNVGGNVVGSVASVTANVNAVLTNGAHGGAAATAQFGGGGGITANITGNLSGSVGSVTGLTAANLDVAVSTRLATAGYTAPDNATITAIAADLPQRMTKNVALAAFPFLMVDSTDHVTPKTGLAITAQRSLDGGAFAACANAAVEIGAGWYAIDLAATDLNANTVALKFSAAAADTRNVTIVTQPT